MISTVARLFLGYQAPLLLERLFGPIHLLTPSQVAVLKNYVEYSVFVFIVVNAVIGRFGSISAKDRLRAEQERSATQNGLTGLLNRSDWEQATKREFDRFARHGVKASLAFLDLDDFKTVNDINGHRSGDEVLISLARTILRGLRGSDLAGRYGDVPREENR